MQTLGRAVRFRNPWRTERTSPFGDGSRREHRTRARCGAQRSPESSGRGRSERRPGSVRIRGLSGSTVETAGKPSGGSAPTPRYARSLPPVAHVLASSGFADPPSPFRSIRTAVGWLHDIRGSSPRVWTVPVVSAPMSDVVLTLTPRFREAPYYFSTTTQGRARSANSRSSASTSRQ